MVIEILSGSGWGGLRFSLDFIEKTLSAGARAALRPWTLIEASPQLRLYLPALSPAFRKATAEKQILWIYSSEGAAPLLTQTLLESGLCEGVLLRGLENFQASSPAAIWGRRWQLAAQKGESHLLWNHEKRQAVIGFDVRMEWAPSGSFEIRKGYGYFNNSEGEGRANFAKVANNGAMIHGSGLKKSPTHPSAA
jgi:hypothetical protein